MDVLVLLRVQRMQRLREEMWGGVGGSWQQNYRKYKMVEANFSVKAKKVENKEGDFGHGRQ